MQDSIPYSVLLDEKDKGKCPLCGWAPLPAGHSPVSPGVGMVPAVHRGLLCGVFHFLLTSSCGVCQWCFSSPHWVEEEGVWGHRW